MIRSTAEGEASPLEKDSRSGETGRKSDPTNARPSEPARLGRCAQEWTPGAPPENVSDDVSK